MKNLDRNLVFGIFFGIITAFYWFVSCTVESLNTSFYICLISFGLIVALIYQKKIAVTWNINRVYISILGFSAIYIICFFLWNHLFNWYSQNHDYSSNIFRGAFDGLRAISYNSVATTAFNI